MELKFGRHYSADLYWCQNKLWGLPRDLEERMRLITGSKSDAKLEWRYQAKNLPEIKISGTFETLSFFVQIFSEKCFVALDIYSWQPDIDIQPFCEALIDLFEPQVVSAETRLRAEHLLNS